MSKLRAKIQTHPVFQDDANFYAFLIGVIAPPIVMAIIIIAR